MRTSGSWVQLSSLHNQWEILYGDQLHDCFSLLNRPDTQKPSITSFIGSTTKARAIRTLFPHSNYKKQPQRGLLGCYYDQTTLEARSPRFFIDINLNTSISTTINNTRGLHYNVTWPCRERKELINHVLTRGVFPFTDVICIFIDDFSSAFPIRSLMENWKTLGQGLLFEPRWILISDKHNVVPDVQMDYEIVYTSQAQLRQVLNSSTEEVRRLRDAASVVFSATHLEVFFTQSFLHLSIEKTRSCNLIDITRKENPISIEFPYHATLFLNICVKFKVTKESIISVLASCILLDSCPPRMHLFDPNLVFRTLYQKRLLQAFENSEISELSALAWSHLIENKFVQQFLNLEDTKISTSESHIQNLRASGIDWRDIKSSQTCFICLQRRPEHVQTCGHTICDICVRIYGKSSQKSENYFQLIYCPLCQFFTPITVKQVPPTAFYRILTIDGGGIGGLFSLLALQKLEEVIDLPNLIQDEFDLAMGTSSGGLIVLLLAIIGKPVKFCTSVFEALARRAFSTTGNSIFGRVSNIFKSWIRDGLYDPKPLEACLEEVFGRTHKIFDRPLKGISGAKVAVTATTIQDSTLCIFSNYNGSPSSRIGYNHFRPQDVSKEISLFDAARATSAAPLFFPPKFIPEQGYVQDGGVGRHNNPIEPSQWEGRKIWGIKSEFVLSIGTGYLDNENSISATRHRVWDSFIFRLVRSLRATNSGRKNWLDYWNRLDENDRENSFRIDLPLTTGFELDDIKYLDQIRDLSVDLLGNYDFSKIEIALLCANFFFALDSIPSYNGSFYECTGFIHCRSPDRGMFIKKLGTKFPLAYFFDSKSSSLGKIQDGEFCEVCGRYRQRIKLKVSQLDQITFVGLHLIEGKKRAISGFPNPISWFVKRQSLLATFGTADHRVKQLQNEICNCTNDRKRKREGTS